MRVHNETDNGVFVQNYGVVAAHAEATVRDSDAVRQLIKTGVLTEVQPGSSGPPKPPGAPSTHKEEDE
jgi:hypothetical protein